MDVHLTFQMVAGCARSARTTISVGESNAIDAIKSSQNKTSMGNLNTFLKKAARYPMSWNCKVLKSRKAPKSQQLWTYSPIHHSPNSLLLAPRTPTIRSSILLPQFQTVLLPLVLN